MSTNTFKIPFKLSSPYDPNEISTIKDTKDLVELAITATLSDIMSPEEKQAEMLQRLAMIVANLIPSSGKTVLQLCQLTNLENWKQV